MEDRSRHVRQRSGTPSVRSWTAGRTTPAVGWWTTNGVDVETMSVWMTSENFRKRATSCSLDVLRLPPTTHRACSGVVIATGDVREYFHWLDEVRVVKLRNWARIHRYCLKIYPRMCHKIILRQKLWCRKIILWHILG